MTKNNEFLEELKEEVINDQEIDSSDINLPDDPPPIMTLQEKREWERKLKLEIKRALEDNKKKDKKESKEETDSKDKKEELEDQGEVSEEKLNKEVVKDENELEDNSGADTEKAYLDRQEIIHRLKIEMYRKQIDKHTITPDKDLFYQIVELERQNKLERRKIKEPTHELKEKETEMLKSEMAYEKKIRDAFMVKAKKVDTLAIELKECNDKIKDLKKFQLEKVSKPDKAFDPDEYNKRLDDYEAQRLNVLMAIYLMEPKQMEIEQEELSKLKQDRNRAIQPGDIERIQNLPDDVKEEVIANTKYGATREAKAEEYVSGTNEYIKNSKSEELIQAEAAIDELEKERKKLPKNPTTVEDIEKVTLLTRQLSEAKSVKESLEEKDKVGTDKEEIITEAGQIKKEGETREKVAKELEDVEEVIDSAKVKAEEKRIEDPYNNTKELVNETAKGAIIGGMVAGEKGAKVGAGVGFLSELREQRQDPSKMPDAKDILKNEKEIDSKSQREVSKELKEAEKMVDNM